MSSHMMAAAVLIAGSQLVSAQGTPSFQDMDRKRQQDPARQMERQ